MSNDPGNEAMPADFRMCKLHKVPLDECPCNFRHACPDWDGMNISLLDTEAIGCSCYRGVSEADALYDEAQRDLDAHNEQRRIDRLRET